METVNAKDTDVVMAMYNLIRYSNNCSKTSGSLWQYYRDKPAINDGGNIIDFPNINSNNNNNNSVSFEFKQKITDKAEPIAQKCKYNGAI